MAQHTETHHLKMLDGLALQLRHSIQHFHREQVVDEEDDAAMLAAFRKITAFAMHVFCALSVQIIFTSGWKKSTRKFIVFLGLKI